MRTNDGRMNADESLPDANADVCPKASISWELKAQLKTVTTNTGTFECKIHKKKFYFLCF